MRNNNHKYKVWNPKKYLILFICLILFYLSFIATTVSTSESLTLKVGIYENSPKIFTDDKGNALGFWPDIIEYIALQEGWQIEWVCCIWSQCMEKLENNEIDLMPDVSFTEPRSKRYAFSQETVLTSWTRIYARKGANIQSILDLKGKKIGVMTGSVNFTGLGGIKELTENFDLDCTFVEMNNYTEVFEALEKGEIDVGVTNKDFGNKYEKDFDIDKTSIIFRPSHIQFAFPKNSSLTPYLLERVDYHMKELKKSKDSIYYQSLEKWLAVEVGEREVIPEWINWLLVGIGGIALLFFGVNIILRSQVRSKTKELRQDITERKVAEEELKETTELLQSVMDNATDEAIITTDQIGIILIWNEGARRLLGYESEEMVGRESIRIFHTEEYLKSRIMDVNIKKMITMGKPLVEELDYVSKDGKTIPVQEIVSPRFDGDGKFIGMVGMARDITERKQAEAELLVKNWVFEASIAANSTSDNEGIITYVNNAFIRLFGYENKEEAIGKPISDFLKFEDEATNIITALNESGVWEGEYTGLKKNGSTFTAYGLATTIKDRSGDSIGYQSAVLDISDRKRMEENLRESEEKYSSVVENSLDGIIVVQKGIIKFLNQAILDLTGYNLEELIDKEFESLLSPEYRKLIMKRYRARLAGKKTPSIYEIEVIRKDGISVPIEVSNTTIIYGGEKATLSFIRNITERKQIQERLKKTMDATIETMSRMIEAKDPYTSGHQHRVCQLAVPLAQELDLSEDKIEGIRIASLIHDIGKIGLPTEILSKPSKLTDIEFGLIKGHSQIGYDVLKSIDFPYPIARIVLQHHEKINGTGYPNNLKGDKILLEAKIIGVADVVEAMSSHRPYRPALGIDVALEEISKNRGILYDPEIVDACLKLFKEKGFKFKREAKRKGIIQRTVF